MFTHSVCLEKAEHFTGNFPERVSELSAEKEVDGEVGGAVDHCAEPHNVVEYAGVGPHHVGYA